MASPANQQPGDKAGDPDPLDEEVDVELEDDSTPSGVEAAIERAAAGATDGDTSNDDVSAIGSQMAAETSNPPPPTPIVRPPSKPLTGAEMRRRQMAKKKKERQMQLKSAAVPVLAVIGLMLFGFGIYGIRVLTNDQDTRANKDTMGLLMVLAGGPVGFMLMAGAAWFFMQIRQHKSMEAQEISLDDNAPASGPAGGAGNPSASGVRPGTPQPQARPLPKPRAPSK